MKNYLIRKVEHHSSPFSSVYQKSFSTEHVLIRLLKEWRNTLDNNNVIAAFLAYLSFLTDIFKTCWWLTYGFNKDTVPYTYTYSLDIHILNKWYLKLPWTYYFRCSTGINNMPHFIVIFLNKSFFFILLATANIFTDDY